jgi:hypothetical protein
MLRRLRDGEFDAVIEQRRPASQAAAADHKPAAAPEPAPVAVPAAAAPGAAPAAPRPGPEPRQPMPENLDEIILSYLVGEEE